MFFAYWPESTPQNTSRKAKTTKISNKHLSGLKRYMILFLIVLAPNQIKFGSCRLSGGAEFFMMDFLFQSRKHHFWAAVTYGSRTELPNIQVFFRLCGLFAQAVVRGRTAGMQADKTCRRWAGTRNGGSTTRVNKNSTIQCGIQQCFNIELLLTPF